MEPLKPEVKRKALRENPLAAPEEIEEYERLLSERFTKDPDFGAKPKSFDIANEQETRLKELQRKLFPEQVEDDTPSGP